MRVWTRVSATQGIAEGLHVPLDNTAAGSWRAGSHVGAHWLRLGWEKLLFSSSLGI